jgi:hypothetical protein
MPIDYSYKGSVLHLSLIRILVLTLDADSEPEQLKPSRALWALDSAGLSDNAFINRVLVISDSVGVAEVVEVGVGGAKQTRLFLILGDLAVQLSSN